jgi:predicted  nucleic acid-binding Zn-ribbon protein
MFNWSRLSVCSRSISRSPNCWKPSLPLPRHLRSIEEKLQQQKLAVEQADKAVPVEEARRRRLESDRKDQQQKLIKYRDQSSSVKTNEQFHALQHEIGFVEAEIRRIEDEELTSMIKSESLESQRFEARKALALQAKLVDEEKERARIASQGYQEELASPEGTGQAA